MTYIELTALKADVNALRLAFQVAEEGLITLDREGREPVDVLEEEVSRLYGQALAALKTQCGSQWEYIQAFNALNRAVERSKSYEQTIAICKRYC